MPLGGWLGFLRPLRKNAQAGPLPHRQGASGRGGKPRTVLRSARAHRFVVPHCRATCGPRAAVSFLLDAEAAPCWLQFMKRS